MFKAKHIQNGKVYTVYAVMGSLFLVWGCLPGEEGWNWLPMELFRPEGE